MPEHIASHEQGPKQPEQTGESAAAERHREQLEQQRVKAEQELQDRDNKLNELSKQAQEEAAKNSIELNDNADKQPEPLAGSMNLGMTKSMKKDAYKREMAHVRKKLPPTERAFSKFIHQPSVDKVSDLSAKTIARPSALLGGGLGALVGTVVLVFISRHYGIVYNYVMLFLCFLVGMLVGLLVEMLIDLVRHKKP